jgi:formylglycine-generating enzyme required for sulfatase activity
MFAPVGQTRLNEIQQTMIDQLKHLNPLWRGEFGVRMIIIMDENTLRFPMAIGRHKVNVDLKYEEGDDLYRISAYDINAFTRKVVRIEGTPTEAQFDQAKRDATIYDEGGLFWEDLIDVLRHIANAVDK